MRGKVNETDRNDDKQARNNGLRQSSMPNNDV